ncbi:altronate dehydratase family protein, partial [Maribacter arcticus]
MQKKLIKVQAEDNVAIALVDLVQGDRVQYEGEDIIIISDTKAKHKIAFVDFDKEDQIFMYGVLVGKAMFPIKKGDVLTTENVKHQSDLVTKRTKSVTWSAPDISKWKDRTFMGYHRSDGQVGTQNVWLFFPLVFCENRNIEVLKEVFEKELSMGKERKQRQLLRNLINGKDADFNDGKAETSS